MREAGERSHRGRPGGGALSYPSRPPGPILPPALDARVAELVDAADSVSNLSPRREIRGVKPVKLGEGPEALAARADAEPSPVRGAQGRCREQTAGTYGLHGHGEGVLQTTNP
jgi:hypothetical protein